MYDYDELIKELEQEGYTEEDIEEYIRSEVNKDKNKKYEELDKVKLTYFVFLLGLASTEAFKEEVKKIIKKPNHDYSKVKKMIKEINPKTANTVFKEPDKETIEKLKFKISDFDELKARDKYIRIITNYYGRTLGTIKKEHIKEAEYLLEKVSKYDKIEKVVPYYDKKGNIVAYHDIASYNSMVYNTNLTNSVWNETLDNAIATNNDLVYVPGHWGSCPYCLPYEDRVYSLTDTNPIFPNIQVALDGGLKHPNCKHPIENYNSEIKTTPSVSSPPEVYNSLQKINALELKKNRLKTDKAIYKELGSYEDIDKVNQKIRKINENIKEQKSILKRYK